MKYKGETIKGWAVVKEHIIDPPDVCRGELDSRRMSTPMLLYMEGDQPKIDTKRYMLVPVTITIKPRKGKGGKP